MALPTIDTYRVGDGNANETLAVGVTGQTLTYRGNAAAANVTACLTTGAATALVAYANTAQLQAHVDATNAILVALKNAGIMASS